MTNRIPPNSAPKKDTVTDSETDATVGNPSDNDNMNIHTLVARRKKMAAKVERLKNEKLEKQLQKMEEREARSATQSAQSATLDLPRNSVPQTVRRTQVGFRHFLTLIGFVAIVGAPNAISTWYLWERAHDRYVSYAGFSVITEEIGTALETFMGLGDLGGSSSSDTDIIYKFIQSPELVRIIDSQYDLRSMWSGPGRNWLNASHDPVFAYNPESGVLGLLGPGSPLAQEGAEITDGSIEELTEYWQRMVSVYSDSGTGLIDLEVQAFSPEDAHTIAQAIFDESSLLINRLSAIARDDTTRYAREELDNAVERLKDARSTLTGFRNRTQIIDPTASIQDQMGLLSSLQQQLAQSLIDLDILRQATRENDPRIEAEERRVAVIEARIDEERLKLGFGGSVSISGNTAFADLLGEYEILAVEQEFAEQSYIAALASYDNALGEANQQSRYLAAHVNPTLPESAVRPNRITLQSLIALFSFLIWATTILVVYAIRDRR